MSVGIVAMHAIEQPVSDVELRQLEAAIPHLHWPQAKRRITTTHAVHESRKLLRVGPWLERRDRLRGILHSRFGLLEELRLDFLKGQLTLREA